MQALSSGRCLGKFFQNGMSETVVILGASTNPRRYSHKAQLALLANGHVPIPVNPRYDQINGVRCYPSLQSVPDEIDTVTVYVRPNILLPMAKDIIGCQPNRVIFNPGAESDEVATRLQLAGIAVQNACTLVLLNTSNFTNWR